MSPIPKRPLLTMQDRARLRRLADKAAENGAAGYSRAYCSGVVDVLLWLDGGEMSALMRDMTR